MMNERNGGKNETIERTSDEPREANTALMCQWSSDEGGRGRTRMTVAKCMLISNIDVRDSRKHSKQRMRIQQQSQTRKVPAHPTSSQLILCDKKDAKREN